MTCEGVVKSGFLGLCNIERLVLPELQSERIVGCEAQMGENENDFKRGMTFHRCRGSKKRNTRNM